MPNQNFNVDVAQITWQTRKQSGPKIKRGKY
jgi:hypothetical protein